MNITAILQSPLHICTAWHEPNHPLFQFASGFLLLSYLAPTGIYGLLYLRCCLTIASLFYTLWGWLILCSIDTSLWNLVFTFINAIYVAIIIFKINPFIRFPHDVELVYRYVFVICLILLLHRAVKADKLCSISL
ncbi:Blood vessel epicardial substance-like protein [Leptotrombidium deliense]|uniref:Blood vessel epicardial substance-like protein n=1 Tax=Leptotrombidium deliense TaxID=299467 RepID=A0A443RZB5_9ACAR|nr:Blood vessel epicardial substance-like protein [Leptotrombidium deliense]